MNILTTENLTLREFTIDDATQFFLNCQDDLIKKFMPYRSFANKTQAKKHLESLITATSSLQINYFVAIVKTDIDELIGHIGINEMHKGLEIEYAISKPHRGNNYGAEAVKAFSRWSKEYFNLDLIYALVGSQNISSSRTLERAGFTFLKTDNEGEFNKRGESRKVYVY